MSKRSFLRGAALGAILSSAVAVFLSSKAGKKPKEEIKKFAADISKKVAVRAEETAKLTKKNYEQIVETVVSEYAKDKKAAQKVAKKIAEDLKGRWEEIKEEFKPKKKK